MHATRTPGSFQVVQLSPQGALREDYDAEEWSYVWVQVGPSVVLRLMHDQVETEEGDFEYVEYSTPVNISFVPDF